MYQFIWHCKYSVHCTATFLSPLLRAQKRYGKLKVVHNLIINTYISLTSCICMAMCIQCTLYCYILVHASKSPEEIWKVASSTHVDNY